MLAPESLVVPPVLPPLSVSDVDPESVSVEVPPSVVEVEPSVVTPASVTAVAQTFASHAPPEHSAAEVQAAPLAFCALQILGDAPVSQ